MSHAEYHRKWLNYGQTNVGWGTAISAISLQLNYSIFTKRYMTCFEEIWEILDGGKFLRIKRRMFPEQQNDTYKFRQKFLEV